MGVGWGDAEVLGGDMAIAGCFIQCGGRGRGEHRAGAGFPDTKRRSRVSTFRWMPGPLWPRSLRPDA